MWQKRQHIMRITSQITHPIKRDETSLCKILVPLPLIRESSVMLHGKINKWFSSEECFGMASHYRPALDIRDTEFFPILNRVYNIFVQQEATNSYYDQPQHVDWITNHYLKKQKMCGYKSQNLCWKFITWIDRDDYDIYILQFWIVMIR